MSQGKELLESRCKTFEELAEANHKEDGGMFELSYDVDETAARTRCDMPG